MNYKCLFFALGSSLFLNGCMSWFFGDSDEQVAQPKEVIQRTNNAHMHKDTTSQLELKMAKLWAKVSELEDRSNRQRERIGVLEKGLMLGVLPDELKHDADKPYDEPTDREVIAAPKRGKKITDSSIPMKLPSELVTEKHRRLRTNSEGSTDRKELLTKARNFYESGQYGRAIAVYSKLEQSDDQSHRYWVALCWFHLKEYETSFKEFSSFINNNPKSAWIPRAKYHLARVEYQLGYRDRALKQMKAVIQEFPEEDAADMARASVGRWERSL